MSWLSIQLPNPFKSLTFSDDHDDDNNNNQQHQPDEQEFDQNESQLSENDAGAGGVKDDLTAIGDSISRRFRGVAAFLAPPSTAETAASSSAAVEGIRSDLAEIGGSFKSTLSLFSNPNKAVSEISRFASDFLQLNEEITENFDDDRVKIDDDNDDNDDDDDDDDDEDDDDEEEYGVSDEVIEFARQISDRSELWIDFPLPLDDLVFDMSEAQSEHASIVEQLVPSLADLKNKISSAKSDLQFWMIYFILLLPRLNDDDLELLSTPQIVKARETLLMMLREKKSEESNSENPQPHSSSASDDKVDHAEPENISSVGDVKTIENPNSLSKESTESITVEKIAGVQDARSATSTQCDPVNAKDDDPKLSEVPLREVPKAHENFKGFQTEDDVSFSDLEEDDDNDLRNREPSSGSSQIKRNSSTEGSTDWVRLHEGARESHVRGQSGSRERDSEGEESTDWLTVDDFDP
ncbi:hypothetical protein vseg_016452 [Gypsophila vaccaria]